MAYGDLKVNNLIYDTGSGDASRSVVSIPLTASPTFTGTVTVPTPTAGDNSTKAATTAFVVASFATKASPTFTGTVVVPTATAGDNSTAAASTAFVATSFAPLASPTLTGTPAAPTAAANTNTTQIATTAFVMTEIGDYATLAAPALTGNATAVNLTLSGNLVVNGTTTTVASTNTTIADNLLELNSGASSNANDSGIIIERGSTGDNAIFAWDESADKFIVGTTTGTASSTGNITIAAAPLVTSTVEDSKGNLRSIILNNQSSGAYVAVAADAGKAIHIQTGGVTVNNSIFSAGDAVTIINNSANDQTITQGSGLTIHNSADASSGNRTLAGRGMATIWFRSASEAYISGAGLS